MKTENSSLMRLARESLKNRWGQAIGTYLVYSLIIGSFGIFPKEGGILGLLIAGPLMLGAAMYSLSISRGEESRLEQIFDGFRYFGNALGAYLLMTLYVFLWLLLLIIPGIIAALSYSMVFYIFADNRSVPPSELLRMSKKMMDGYKEKLFYLWLRFLLLGLLCILTLGIGFLWLVPYVHVTMAKFYEDIRSGAH